LKIKVALDGQEIKSCLSLKGEFFLSVVGVTIVFSYGFKISLDFFGSFFHQGKNEHEKPKLYLFFLIQKKKTIFNRKQQ